MVLWARNVIIVINAGCPLWIFIACCLHKHSKILGSGVWLVLKIKNYKTLTTVFFFFFFFSNISLLYYLLYKCEWIGCNVGNIYQEALANALGINHNWILRWFLARWRKEHKFLILDAELVWRISSLMYIYIYIYIPEKH